MVLQVLQQAAVLFPILLQLMIDRIGTDDESVVHLSLEAHQKPGSASKHAFEGTSDTLQVLAQLSVDTAYFTKVFTPDWQRAGGASSGLQASLEDKEPLCSSVAINNFGSVSLVLLR
jgi:hypothetical protein